MRAVKRPEVAESALLYARGREVAWKKVDSYESIGSSELEWKRLNDGG